MASAAGSPSTGESTTLMKKLKEHTANYHAELESLPYFIDLTEHKLPLEKYIHQLQALAVIHGVFESEISAVANDQLEAVWDEDLRKLPFLNADLDFFRYRVIAENSSAIDSAMKMVANIRLRRAENPVTLLGYLYVLEGSTLGNHMHLQDILATFSLVNFNGCNYYASYREQVQGRWSQFTKKMNSIAGETQLHEAIIEAAQEAFAVLKELYSVLSQSAPQESIAHVSRINPEAGNHPIPEDEREIQAALRASKRVWGEFPYFEHRYGERGKKFSDSDNCWLVTLVSLDDESMQKQIDWLCRLLATRGMPSVLLETNLRFLHEELVAAIPENASNYSKLAQSADSLRGFWKQFIDEKEFEAVNAHFNLAVGEEMAVRFNNTCSLLVSAVIDERKGAEGAVEKLTTWLTNKDTFPEEWVRAVKEARAKAEEIIVRKKS